MAVAAIRGTVSASARARGAGEGWGSVRSGSAAAAVASWWRWRRAPPPVIRPHRSRRPAADSRPVRHGGVRVAPARARGRRDVPAAGGVPAEEAPPFLGFLRRRSSTATTQGSRGYSRGGGGGGGSMGVAMCAGCPSGPVSREIRLRWWCLPIIINDPNFIQPGWTKHLPNSAFTFRRTWGTSW